MNNEELKLLTEISNGLKEVKDEMKEVRNDVNGLKDEMKEVRNDVNGLKDEMKEIRNDVNELKDEMKEVRNDVNDLRDEMKEVRNDVNGLKDEMKELKDQVGTIDVRVMSVEVILENQVDKSIKFLAEAHVGLVEKVDNIAVDVEETKETVSILKFLQHAAHKNSEK